MSNAEEIKNYAYELYKNGPATDISDSASDKKGRKAGKVILSFIIAILLLAVIFSYGFLLTHYAVKAFNASEEEKSVVEIDSFDKLKKLEGKFYTNKTYKLMADITLNEGQSITIGSAQRPFYGTFNGNNKTITYNYTDKQPNALFGFVAEGAKITNLKVKGSKIFGENGVGAVIAAYNYGEIEKCEISDFTVTVKNYATIGGIAAYNYGTVSNCSVNMEIKKDGDGGNMQTCFGGICAVNAKAESKPAQSGSGAANLFKGIKGVNSAVTFFGFIETQLDIKYDEYDGGNFYIGAVVGRNDGAVQGAKATAKNNIGGELTEAYVADRDLFERLTVN